MENISPNLTFLIMLVGMFALMFLCNVLKRNKHKSVWKA